MELIRFLQTFASPNLDAIVFFLTNLGSERAYIVMLVIAYVGIKPVLGQRLGIALLASLFLNQHAKAFFDLPRPFELDASLARSKEALATALGEGFPSGHAQSSTTFWGLAAVYLKKTWFWLLAILIIAAVSFSRLYLGVHFPIDVWGGIAFGAALVVLVKFIFTELEVLKGISKRLIIFLGITIPLTFQWHFATVDSSLILGALSAFVVGPALIRHQPSMVLWKRVALVILALSLAFGVLIASSLFLSEEIKRSALGGFIRYFVIGLVGTALIPYIGRITGLAERVEQQDTRKAF